MSLTISPTGTRIDSVASGNVTFTPTLVNVGDLVTVCVEAYNSSYPTISSIAKTSGTGSTSAWQKAVAIHGVNSGTDQEIWYATVLTTGTPTFTITYSAGIGTHSPEYIVQQFGTGNVNTIWSVVTSNYIEDGTAATTQLMPSLTPSVAGQLYLGSWCPLTNASSAGSTSGYTYLAPTSAGNGWMYNANCSSSAQQPNIAQPTADKGTGIAVIFSATLAPAGNMFLVMGI